MRFQQLTKLAVEARQVEVREKFVIGAWIGFQMGAAGGKNFSQYLGELGLAEKQAKDEATPEAGELTAKKAVAKAEGILTMAAEKKDKA